MRRIHDHHGGPDGTIRECDCPNPLASEPVLGSEAIWGRPPPTSYRDEHEVFHPGPRCDGYREHLSDCWSCCRGVIRARGRGESWAMDVALPDQLPPVPMPIPGPGMPREHGALVRLRPQHIGPAAVVVGAASYAITALLAWWLAAPMLLGLFALLVYAGRRDLLEVDRMPPARMLRR